MCEAPWQTLGSICNADAIFHDPFAPNINPRSWTERCFTWEAENLKPAGILTTYSAAGHVRRALARAGFFVAIGPGVGKKRETTRASRQQERLQPLRIKYTPMQEFSAVEKEVASQSEEHDSLNSALFQRP